MDAWTEILKQKDQWLINQEDMRDVNKSYARTAGFTFRVYKLDNYIILEYVDFLNCWYSIHSNSLQGTLKPFIICCSSFVDSLLLSAFKSKNLNENLKNKDYEKLYAGKTLGK